MNKQVVTRFAPSPTGKAHIGSYRTAMYAWLYARHHGGKFILRIEDTDKERNDAASEQDIYEALEWLGLDYDEKYIQSQNLARHKEILQILIDKGSAYISREPGKDDPSVMRDIIRFKNPNKTVEFFDHIRGKISVESNDLGDFVIARNINEPLYHLAVIVDDHDENVTHVIRAEEHIANTPRQILIIEALGWDTPEYAHLPLVLGPDRQKLSKRRGALPVTDYARVGYLPDAVFNAVAMIGWNPGGETDQEIFSRDELIKAFDLAKVQKGSAIFSTEKLNWFNREYLKKLSDKEKIDFVKKYLSNNFLNETGEERLDRAMPTLLERASTGGELALMEKEGMLDYMHKTPDLDKNILTKMDTEENTLHYLREACGILESNTFADIESLKSALMTYADKLEKRGNFLHPLRYALSGLEKSPDPFTISFILGKDETLSRIKKACALLS